MQYYTTNEISCDILPEKIPSCQGGIEFGSLIFKNVRFYPVLSTKNLPRIFFDILAWRNIKLFAENAGKMSRIFEPNLVAYFGYGEFP
jgi:hypothetical protein